RSIGEHRGRIVGSAGDSVLAEFASPVAAVQCAVEIQAELGGRNDQLPEPRRMEFRIGINLGDVIVDASQIYGDGVNVAARLEGYAEPGGIAISGSVFDQVGGKLDVGFASQGRHRVKNIPDKVRIYFVDPTQTGASGTIAFPGRFVRTPAGIASLVGAAAVLVVAGVLLWREFEARQSPGEAVAPRAAAGFRIWRDCADCPELVEIPAGAFQMGASEREAGHRPTEGPVHAVSVAKPFGIGRYEITFAQWDLCVADGGCSHQQPNDRGWGRGTRPVIYVNWTDAQEYIAWLSRKTGRAYRLLSEAEWEYAARGGTAARFPWGEEVGANNANCLGCGPGASAQTMPVGSYPANPFGLYDMHGNVWEWTADCWNGSYGGAPADGSAWTIGECNKRVVRGGAWGLVAEEMRSARRDGDVATLRSGRRGFRVARDLP
ncbi:MAG: SUMF1/EgtB/PvdO family nonheme iron enzyme, partial [Pseudomonadota bacterium]